MEQNTKTDLWKDFTDSENAQSVRKRSPTDGSEWTGQYDLREKPREEQPPQPIEGRTG